MVHRVCCGLMQNQDMKRVELKLKETTAPVAWWVPLKSNDDKYRRKRY